MATSLGYVLMNWTSTFTKKKNRQKNKKNGNSVTNVQTNAKETKCCQTTGKYDFTQKFFFVTQWGKESFFVHKFK